MNISVRNIGYVKEKKNRKENCVKKMIFFLLEASLG